MKGLLNKWLAPGPAVVLCGWGAAASVALAFLGPERAGGLMSAPFLLGVSALLAAALGAAGVRAAARRRFDSALLHVGAACVVAGWLAGRMAERASTPERPATGSMALVDGDVSDKLWTGETLTTLAGVVPFTVRLEKFFIERYERSGNDRDEGREAPVREYRSRVTISEPGRPPYVANVRVNHPVYVRGYHIYQMSWGQSTDMAGRPVVYTVLQFIRDPGLPVVYGGFVALLAGLLLFAWRVVLSDGGEAGGRAP